ncbi:Sugar phosphate isomerase/epimerase [Streptomyces sp. DvalAA-14]|uniref:sugar phosphate isomerase/epimerase family protein n=1 Tax=unclassified Streptomyces TaxID=2593676 RepID=UPI00081B5484|nr:MULTISPECIES: TIM barrel protein [unclassified Streptomyces]MYS21096.1 TIM barrel protein [Streptomyces sp. SID4948]SCD84015.1 Sugar phosphate isomerase/epimerase [Streptomyces sp. DvalAA-14]
MTTGHPLGIQLYSVRDDIAPADLGRTLARLAALGFTHAEPYDILTDTAGLGAALRSAGLRADTAHASVLRHDETALLDAAEALGVRTVITPYVDPGGIADRDGVERLAAALNGAAQRAAARGIRIGYHNHDFEFAQAVDGVPAYELLVRLLDPAVVLEVDVYWAGVGGADVFELLPRLGERLRLLHVVHEREPGNDRPVLGVDTAGRMSEVLALTAATVELPVVEVVAHHSDVWPLVERNAAYFLGQVNA